MNKKIVSIITALLLILQCFTAFAAQGTTEDLAVQNKDLLVSLGIADENADISSVATRGQAAKYIARMFGSTYAAREYKGVFADVPADYESALEIETLADFGIVRGDGNFKFYPDSYLTYNDAAYIFAYALGYSITGNLPNQAHTIVNRHGIWDGVLAEYDYVTFADLFTMIANTLHSGVLEQVSYGSKNEYKVSEDDLLYKNFGVLKTYGVVVKNDISYLWTVADVDNSTIEVETEDGKTLVVDIEGKNIDTRDILGKYVTLYYKYDNVTRKCEYVHHIEEDTDKIYSLALHELELDKSSIDNGKIFYYNDKGELKEIKLASDCSLIYNNTAYKSHTIDFATLKNKVGFVELIDYDLDKKYDVIKLKKYDTFIVGTNSKTYKAFHDRYASDNIISYNEEDYSKMYVEDVNGRPVDVSTIEEGDVLSIATSDSFGSEKKSITIIVSKGIVNGKITEYQDYGYEKRIVLDGTTEYKLADRAVNSQGYKIGTNVAVYVDGFGNAVYITNDYGRNMQYALVIGLDVNERTFGNVDLKLKVRTLDGGLKILDVSNVVTIDGRVYKENLVDAYAALTAAKTDVGNVGVVEDVFLVRYSTDANGKVKVIDTPERGAGGDKDSLEKMIGGKLIVDRQKVIGNEVALNSGATLINVVVEDMFDASLYEDINSVYTSTMAMSFGNTTTYNVVAYRSDLTSPYADIAINFTNGALSMDETLFVIDSVKHAYDATLDENIYRVEGYLSGNKKTYWFYEEGTSKQTTTEGGFVVSDELKNAVRGDVLRLVVDASNKITAYDYIFKRGGEADELVRPLFYNDLYQTSSTSYSMWNGYVKSRYNELLTVAHLYNFGEVPAPTDELFASVNVQTLVNAIPGSVQIVVVDDAENKIFIGTANDIRDYERYGSDASLILAKFRTNTMTDVIIYNK